MSELPDYHLNPPPADPQSPETRLLRAILGLCPDCDINDPHLHGGYVNGYYIPIAEWGNRPNGIIEWTEVV